MTVWLQLGVNPVWPEVCPNATPSIVQKCLYSRWKNDYSWTCSTNIGQWLTLRKYIGCVKRYWRSRRGLWKQQRAVRFNTFTTKIWGLCSINWKKTRIALLLLVEVAILWSLRRWWTPDRQSWTTKSKLAWIHCIFDGVYVCWNRRRNPVILYCIRFLFFASFEAVSLWNRRCGEFISSFKMLLLWLLCFWL